MLLDFGAFAQTSGTGISAERGDEAQVVCRAETPVPADVWPTRLAGAPTGYDLVPPMTDLVVGAVNLQRALAIIPINAEDERLVEEFIAAHAPLRSRSPITRRRTRTA